MVSSYLNSGNILFEAGQDAAEIRRKVETSLKEELGFEIPTLIKSDMEIAKHRKRHPGCLAERFRTKNGCGFSLPGD